MTDFSVISANLCSLIFVVNKDFCLRKTHRNYFRYYIFKYQRTSKLHFYAHLVFVIIIYMDPICPRPPHPLAFLCSQSIKDVWSYTAYSPKLFLHTHGHKHILTKWCPGSKNGYWWDVMPLGEVLASIAHIGFQGLQGTILKVKIGFGVQKVTLFSCFLL